MKRSIASAAGLALGLMLSAGVSVAHQSAPGDEPARGLKVQAGALAPDFELPALNGLVVKLSSLRGKVVLLEFMASWCPACNRDREQITRLRRAFGARLAVISISCDGGEVTDTTRLDLERFVSRHKIDWPVLFDDTGLDGPVAASYGVTSLPVHIVIDRAGVVCFVGRGLHKGSLIERAIRRALRS